MENELTNLSSGVTVEEISNFLKKFESDSGDFSLEGQLADIERHFAGKDSIHQIISELEGKWSQNGLFHGENNDYDGLF